MEKKKSESDNHIKMKLFAKELLEQMGATVEMEGESRSTLEDFVDGIGKFGDLTIAIEVGDTSFGKILTLLKKYSMVIHLPYAFPAYATHFHNTGNLIQFFEEWKTKNNDIINENEKQEKTIEELRNEIRILNRIIQDGMNKSSPSDDADTDDEEEEDEVPKSDPKPKEPPGYNI